MFKRVLARLNQEPKRLLSWYVLGTKTTPPPDLFKQRLVRQVARQFGLTTFVETGTYKGDMIAAVRDTFTHIYSLEAHKPFYDRAVERFAADARIQILYGDSATELANLLATLQEPALFWLDAHGGQFARRSDGTEAPAPVRPELEAILTHSQVADDVILIDDVHTFVRGTKWGAGVWQEIEALREQWLAQHPEWVWKVRDNVLHIYRPRD